ncbi:ABC transporter ATP-binding protein [Christensenellaceae bacterium OttesenSCG-928-L17]|nr:ABC transporter ATP-binding protein [Christensenellaceae bacterium OttesenSCG-928-L17]
MERTSEILIDLRDVKKVYRVGAVDIHALRGVSMQLRRGEICCVVGRSGSGKSTLLNMLAGLEGPTSGEIVIARQHVEKMTQGELILFRQKHVGFIFQSFNLMPYYTAQENVAFPLVFRGIPKKKRLEMAREILCAVGLETHLKHKPMQMSGGQQQRVGIARALVSNPEIIFADEPTGNLDSKTSDEVMHMICNIARERNKTLIMVTHDANMAAFTDKAVHLLDGTITKIEENESPVIAGQPAAEHAPEEEHSGA